MGLMGAELNRTAALKEQFYEIVLWGLGFFWAVRMQG
jgi:hypothetical protein